MAPGRLSPSGSFLSGPCDPTEFGSMVVLTVAVGTWLAGGLQAVVNVDPFSWFSSRPQTRSISCGVNAARSSTSWLVSSQSSEVLPVLVAAW